MRFSAIFFATFSFLISFTPVAQAQDATFNAPNLIGGGTLEIVDPNLAIDIPGLDRTILKNQGVVLGTGSGENGNGCPQGMLCVRTIEIYLNAVYKFTLSASVIIAIVLVMIGGMQWMVGSTINSHEKARERITNALIGLVLLFATYPILAFINPNITSLKPLELTAIQDTEEESEAINANSQTSVNFEKIKSANELTTSMQGQYTAPNGIGMTVMNISDLLIFSGNDQMLQPETMSALLKAAHELKDDQGVKMKVASAGRTMQEQVTLFYERCFGKPCVGNNAVCNPLKGNVASPLQGSASKGFSLKAAYKDQYESASSIIQFLTETATQSGKTNCPHVNGYAVDVWCNGESSTAVNPQCHEALEEAMVNNGFCRIYSEGWHFELKTNATSDAAKRCDAPIGQVTADMTECNQTPPSLEYEIVQLGSVQQCMFDYRKCTRTATIKGTTGCN